MPENQNFKGDRWTKQSIKLLSRLGWLQLGTANFDIPCINHSSRNGQGHGIDSVFKYYDPYFGKTINVLVESKERQWNGLQPAKMKEFIIQVIESLECAPYSDEFIQLNAADIYTGLVLCWCNDGEYNHINYLQRLEKIGFRKRNNPYKIYLASNYDVLRWLSVVDEVNALKTKEWEIKYFYPSLNYSDRSDAYKSTHITLIHMFSKYIFAYSSRIEKYPNQTTMPVTSFIVFSFDEVSVPSLMLLYDVCKQYQMQSTDEIIIYLYANEETARVYAEQFKRTLIVDDGPKVIVRYLKKYDGIEAIPYISE